MKTTKGLMPFLPNHGYFVSTLSDEDDNDNNNLHYNFQSYWNEDDEPYRQTR